MKSGDEQHTSAPSPAASKLTTDLSNSRHPLLDRALLRVATFHTRRLLAGLLGATENIVDCQSKTLAAKITRNTATDFGTDYGFKHIRSYDDFTRHIPILDYETLEPYIEKVKSGNLQAMFGPGQQVHMFAKTSGTTNKPKYIPVSSPFLKEYRQGWNIFGIKVLLDHPDAFLRPIAQVTSPMDEEYSNSGIPCGAITGLMAATQKRLVRRYYVVPRDVAYITDATARYYCAMRFCIASDIGFMITANPATHLKLARIADRHATQMIRDIHDGSINHQMAVAENIRRKLLSRLKPDPATARKFDRLLSATGRLLPKDYWRLGFIANWTGGTMGLHLRDFPEYFGDTPVRDIGLLASEGRMSIPLTDGTPSGVLDIRSNFYEFIPSNEYGSEKPTVLRAHELETNHEYFILITTSAGFYRYDIGDRVRVTGFHNQTPLIEFLHKGVHSSSITGEKLTEQQIVLAFDRVTELLGLKTQNFVLAPQWDECPFYRLHLQKSPSISHDTCRSIAREFERQLRQINIEYASKRDSGRLQPVQLNILPPDWLNRFDQEEASRQRAGNEQYKHKFLLSDIGADLEFPLYRNQLQ